MRNLSSNRRAGARVRPAYRHGYRPPRRTRVACHPAARLPRGAGNWPRPPNPARLLRALVRRIIKFHDSQPLLNTIDG